MLNQFKEFALRGNVIDLAVGVIIGGAFGKIVSSLVSDVIMPPVGLLLGRINFSDLYFNLSGTPYASLKLAQEAGAPTINYGLFLNTLVDFLIIAGVIFLALRPINALQRANAAPPAETRECPYCCTRIPRKAVRCPHCTSELGEPGE